MVDRFGGIQSWVEHAKLEADGSATDPSEENHQLESRIPTDPGAAVIPDLGDAVIGMYFIG